VEHLSARISASAVREFRSARARRRRRTVISRQPAGQCVMVQVLFRPSGAQQWARSAAAASSRDRHAVRIERIGRTLDAARLLGSHLEWSELRRSNSLQQKLRRNCQPEWQLEGPLTDSGLRFRRRAASNLGPLTRRGAPCRARRGRRCA
jgi:hypothetical protein